MAPSLFEARWTLRRALKEGRAAGQDPGLTSRTTRPEVASSTTILFDEVEVSRWLGVAGLKQTATAESTWPLARSRALISTRSSWVRAANSHRP